MGVKGKMIAVFSAIVLISCVVLSITGYFSSVKLVENSVSSIGEKIAVQAAGIIDPEQYEDILRQSGESDNYDDVRSVLNGLRETTGLEYLYTISREETSVGYDYYYAVDGLPLGDEEAAAFGEKEENTLFHPMMNKVFETGEPQTEMQSTAEYGDLVTSYVPIKSTDGDVIGIVGADYDVSAAYAMMKAEKLKLALLTVACLLVSVVFIFVFTHYLLKPLKKLAGEVGKVQRGDLSSMVKPSSSDEFGQLMGAFQEMVNDLRAIIQCINKSAGQLVETTDQLLDGAEKVKTDSRKSVEAAEQIADGTVSQLAQAKQSVQVIEELSASVQNTAASSSIVSERSGAAVKEAEKGYQSVHDVISRMKGIHESVEHSGAAVRQLESQSAEITSIIQLIQAVAAQTNLLALNAAIEAARAGEHGRGFAVVAEEVRKLADQSAESAQTVAALLSSMNEHTLRSVEAMETVAERVENGILAAGEAGTSFEHILASMKDVAHQVEEVTAASEEMAASAGELVTSVLESERIAGRSAQNAAQVKNVSIEQEQSIGGMSDATAKLAIMAEELDGLVQKFKL